MFADLEKKGSKWVLPRGWKPSNKASKPKQQKDKLLFSENISISKDGF